MSPNEKKKSDYLIILQSPPVIALSAFLFLFGLHYLTPFDLERISKISQEGIEIREKQQKQREDTQSVFINLSNQIEQLELRLEKLEPTNGTTTSLSNKDLQQETIVNLAAPTEPGQDSLAKGLEGYIWIGDFDKTKSEWVRPRLGNLNEQPVSISPLDLTIGGQYRVLGAMNVREKLPPNDSSYFRSVQKIGLLPRYTKVELLKTPQARQTVQYWAKVRALE